MAGACECGNKTSGYTEWVNLLTSKRRVSRKDPAPWSECVSKYEGWNFNSGNYLFTTDTK